MAERLLDAFRALFEGKEYHHRRSTLGDKVALHLYEDLFALGRSAKLVDGIVRCARVVDAKNLQYGIEARRGDGTFGEVIAESKTVEDDGFRVPRGHVARAEIGVEVKIVSTAMAKQIERVTSDLRGQITHFRRGGAHPITVAIVGVNHAASYTSFEGDRHFATGEKGRPHPAKMAPKAEERLLKDVRPAYDHFLLLRYRATNTAPFPFEWVNEEETTLLYKAILTRISLDYEQKF